MELKRPKVEINAKDCIKHLQCTITIKGWKQFCWRVRIAFWIIKLASLIFPANMEIKKENKETE